MATGEGPRPTTEEPPLQTGSASLPQNANSLPPQEWPAMFRPQYPVPTAISLLIFGTIWGVLARLGLRWIGKFGDGQVFALVWAQMAGCLIMGIAIRKKSDIERVFPPLFVLCGTGFCASLTTWASMIDDVFTQFANLGEPAGTSRFQAFLSGMAILIVTVATSVTAFQTGRHIGSWIPKKRPHDEPAAGNALVNTISLVIGPLFWLGSLFLLIFGPAAWRSRATFAIVVAPPATILRYFTSKKLNPLSKRFPIGTFTVNSVSVLVFAVMALLARHPRSQLGCAALRGVQDGFCGSLSTISTLVVEVRGLGTGDSYRYLIASWIVSMALFTVVLGPWVWTDDRGPLCWER